MSGESGGMKEAEKDLRKLTVHASMPDLSDVAIAGTSSPWTRSGSGALRQRHGSGGLTPSRPLSLKEYKDELGVLKKENFSLKVRINELLKSVPIVAGKNQEEVAAETLALTLRAEEAERTAAELRQNLADIEPDFEHLRSELARFSTTDIALRGTARGFTSMKERTRVGEQVEEKGREVEELRATLAAAEALDPHHSSALLDKDQEIHKLEQALAEEKAKALKSGDDFQSSLEALERKVGEQADELGRLRSHECPRAETVERGASAVPYTDEEPLDYSKLEGADAAVEKSARALLDLVPAQDSPSRLSELGLDDSARECSMRITELTHEVRQKMATIAKMAKSEEKNNRLVLELVKKNKSLHETLTTITGLGSPRNLTPGDGRSPRTPGDVLRFRFQERYLESFVENGGGQPSPTTLVLHEAVAEVSSPMGVLNMSLNDSLANIGHLRLKAVSLREACNVLYNKLKGSSLFLRNLVERYGGPDALKELEKFVTLDDLDISLSATRAFIDNCEASEASIWEAVEQAQEASRHMSLSASHFNTLPLGNGSPSLRPEVDGRIDDGDGSDLLTSRLDSLGSLPDRFKTLVVTSPGNASDVFEEGPTQEDSAGSPSTLHPLLLPTRTIVDGGGGAKEETEASVKARRRQRGLTFTTSPALIQSSPPAGATQTSETRPPSVQCHRCPELESRIAELQEAADEVSQIRGLYEQLDENLGNADEEIEGLKAAVAESEQARQELQKNLEEVEYTKESLEIQLKSQKTKLEVVERSAKLFESHLDKAQLDVGAKEQELRSISERLEASEAAGAAMVASLEKAEGLLGDAKMESEAKDVELDTLRQKASELSTKLRLVEEAARKSEAHMKRELCRASEELGKLRLDYEQGLAAVSDMEAAQESAERAIEQLKQKLRESRPLLPARNVGLGTELTMPQLDKVFARLQSDTATKTASLSTALEQTTHRLHDNNRQLAEAVIRQTELEQKLAESGERLRDAEHKTEAAMRELEGVKTERRAALEQLQRLQTRREQGAEKENKDGELANLRKTFTKQRHDSDKMSEIIDRLSANNKDLERRLEVAEAATAGFPPGAVKEINKELSGIHNVLSTVNHNLKSTKAKRISSHPGPSSGK